VLDIDGVVADVRHRLHHVAGRPKDWPAFFAGTAADPPLSCGTRLARELAAAHDIVWLTGRPEHLRATTADWLAANRLPAGRLQMRSEGDFRPAPEFKLAVLIELAAGREIGVVVDDDPAVVAAVGAAGLPTRLADWVPYSPTLGAAQHREGRT